MIGHRLSCCLLRRSLSIKKYALQGVTLGGAVSSSSSFVRKQQERWFSETATLKPDVDPSRIVHGMTRERIESDPTTFEYMKANYPELFDIPQVNVDIPDLGEYHKNFFPEKTLQEKLAYKKVRAAKIHHYPRNIRPLTAHWRHPFHDSGTRSCKRLRYHEGFVPGLLHGSNPDLGILSNNVASKVFLKTETRLIQREMDLYHRGFESRVYNLTLKMTPDNDNEPESTVHVVTPHGVQKHPVLDQVYCVNYLRYHAGRPLKIPIKEINQDDCPALKRDAFLLPIARTVECFVEEGADIPDYIPLDLSGVPLKSVLRRDRLLLPDGVRFSDRTLKIPNVHHVLSVVQGGSREGRALLKEETEKKKEQSDKDGAAK